MNNFQLYLDYQGFVEILYVTIASNLHTNYFFILVIFCKIIHIHFKNSKLIKIKSSNSTEEAT